jgi:hypothetical protein
MRIRFAYREEAQTLVQVALALVMLIAFLALAVDVGHIYAERRRMQNAADAGALAGAREICLLPQACGGDWYACAWDYAVNRNGAQTADISRVAWTVTVVARETTDTFFAGIIGIPTVNVGAVASAACGEARSACGLWPIGFDLSRWEELFEAGCNTPFYVWAGQNENNNPDCTIYDCDVNDDGIDDIIDMLGRAWLDFSDVLDPEHPDACAQPGCGAQELKCWIEDSSGAMVTLPACIAGDPGVKAGVKDAVDLRIGDAISIPLYDYLDCMGVTCPGSSIHATEFGCITVLGWVHELVLPRLDGGTPPWKDKVIAAAINCGGCDTLCGSTPGNPPRPWGIWAVSLTQ